MPRTLAVLLLFANVLAGPGPSLGQDRKQPRTDPWGDPLPASALFRTGTLRAHHDVKGPLVMSHDGKVLAAEGPNNSIRVWQAETSKDICRLPGLPSYDGRIYSLALSADGNRLYSGVDDKAIHEWDVRSGKEVRRFSGHTRPVCQILPTPDCKTLVSCDCQEVRVWSIETGDELRRIPADNTIEVDLSTDGKLLATRNYEGSLRLWEAATGKSLNQFKITDANLRCLLFHPDSKKLLGVANDYSTLWEVATGRELRRFKGASYPVAITPDGRSLVAGRGLLCLDDYVEAPFFRWDLETGKQICCFRGHLDGPHSIAVSPDGRVLFSLGGDHTLRRWDVKTGEELDPRVGHQSSVAAIAFSPDGRFVASGSHDGVIRFWDSLSGKEKRQLRTEGEPIELLAFSPDGKTIVSKSVLLESIDYKRLDDPAQIRIRHWDVASGREHRHCDIGAELRGVVAFSSDVRVLAKAQHGSCVRLFDASTGKRMGRIEGRQYGIAAMAFSLDRTMLAVAQTTDMYSTLSLWDVASGKQKSEQSLTDTSFSSVAFSPDGKYLATGGSCVRLWATATGEDLCWLSGDGCVAFSPDGRTLASRGPDNSIILWEMATRTERRRFEGHEVRCMAFSPDGRLLATGGDDTLVMVWDVADGLDAARLGSEKLSDKQLASLWVDLADADATPAHWAIWQLVSAPKQATAFLAERLPVITPAEAKRIARLVAELDADDFFVREKASAELGALGLAAEEDLKKRLAHEVSVEFRTRAQDLLRKLVAPPDPVHDSELRRALRVMEVLEQIGDEKAREALNCLSEKGCSLAIRQEAKIALERMANRRAPER